MTTQNTTIIYQQDFETTKGVFEVHGHKAPHRADFYITEDNLESKIAKLNDLLKGITHVPEENLATFLKNVEKISSEISSYALKNFADLNKVKVTSKHGHGLEIGVESHIKEEFKHKAK